MKTLHLLQTFGKIFYIHKSLVSYLEGIGGKEMAFRSGKGTEWEERGVGG